MSTGIIETFQKAGVDAIQEHALQVMFGKVETADPIKVKVADKLTLTKENISLDAPVQNGEEVIVMKYATGNKYLVLSTIEKVIKNEVWSGGGVVANSDAFRRTGYTPEQLELVLKNRMVGMGKLLHDMEQKWGVNAIFVIAIGTLESQQGDSNDGRNLNNLFGIGPHKYFNSTTACVEFIFGDLFQRPLYYGKTIDEIAVPYCPPGPEWASKVKTIMAQFYAKIG